MVLGDMNSVSPEAASQLEASARAWNNKTAAPVHSSGTSSEGGSPEEAFFQATLRRKFLQPDSAGKGGVPLRVGLGAMKALRRVGRDLCATGSMGTRNWDATATTTMKTATTQVTGDNDQNAGCSPTVPTLLGEGIVVKAERAPNGLANGLAIGSKGATAQTVTTFG
jgi:hypothetical protein